MEYQRPHSSRAGRFWELVERQHGVVARSQLLELGFHPQAIKRRIAARKLHPVRRGVYAVGRPQLTRHGRWASAVLSCGRHAALSHSSAAALWEIGPERWGVIEISVPGSTTRRRPGIVVHRRAVLEPDDLACHAGIPVTSPVRTLVDIAPPLPRRQLERAINEADKRGLTDPDALRAAATGRLAGQPGAGALREALDLHTFAFTDSALEQAFLQLAQQAGLPRPLTQQHVNGFRVDFYWPQLGLVVETDGLSYHRTPSQQTTDRVRDQAHAAAGLVPLRFPHAQIRFQPGHVRRTLAAVADRLSTGADRRR